MQAPPQGDDEEGDEQPQLYWACDMALRLLQERGRGTSSPWATWVASLPQPGQLLTPLACSTDELAAIGDAHTLDEVMHLQEVVESHWEVSGHP